MSLRAHFSQAKFAFALGLLCTVFAAPVSAQSLEDRLRDQLRSTLNELHQAQDQLAALQAAKTTAEQERDALKAQLAAAKAQLAHTGQSAASSRALEADLAKVKGAYTQAMGSAQQAKADHDTLESGLSDAQKKLGLCEDKNMALFKVGNEILAAYENFDIGDAVGANEPFIGAKRVELENIAQGFGDRLQDGKFNPGATHATQPAGGAN